MITAFLGGSGILITQTVRRRRQIAQEADMLRRGIQIEIDAEVRAAHEKLTESELNELFPARPLIRVVDDLVTKKRFDSAIPKPESDENNNNLVPTEKLENNGFTKDNFEETKTSALPTSNSATASGVLNSGDITDEPYASQIAKEIEQNVYELDCPICQYNIGLQDCDTNSNCDNNNENPNKNQENENNNSTEESNDNADILQKTPKEYVMVRILSCNHIFHDQCISMWLLKKPVCPMCNMRFKEAPAPAIEYPHFPENIV